MVKCSGFLCFLVGLLVSFMFLVPYSYGAVCDFSGLSGDDLLDAMSSSQNVSYGNWSYNTSSPFGSCNAPIPAGGNQVYEFGQPDVNGTCKGIRTVVYYDCQDPEPANCSNGVPDSDEQGIDCGGSCSSSCVEKCPPNTTPYNTGGGIPGWPETGCGIASYPNSFGNCPTGTSPDPADPGICSVYVAPVLAAESIDPSSLPDATYGTSLSVVKQVYPETVVDNGDGTETATIVSSFSGPGGDSSSTETTVVRSSGSSPGTGFSLDGSGVGVAPGFGGKTESLDSVPSEAVVGSGGSPESLDLSGFGDDKFSAIQSQFSVFIDSMKSTPLISSLDDVFSLPADPGGEVSGVIDFGMYGSHSVDFSIDSGVSSTISAVLTICSLIVAVFIIFRKS